MQRLLIVDDDESQRKSLCIILKKSGYFVETAGTGEEALLIAKKRIIDLTLLDIRLPDIDGIELVTPLMQFHPDMVIVMMTGFASVENTVRSLDAGVMGYLVKPIIVGEMLAKVSDLLNKQRLIREKQQAQEALRISEEKFRYLIQTMQEGIWSIDTDWNTTFVNQHIADMLGYTIDEMMGKPLFYFMDEQGVQIAERNLDLRKSGIKEWHTFEFIKKNGSRMYTSMEIGPVSDDNGNYVGAIAGVIDITSQRLVELDLVSAQNRLKELYRLAHIGTFYRDIVTDTLTLSEELVHIAGRNPSLPPPAFSEISRYFTPESGDRLVHAIHTLLKTKEPIILDLELLRPDGTTRWVQARSAVVFDTSGEVCGFHGTILDINEYKLAQEALCEANKKVSLLTSLTRHDIINKLSSMQVLLDLALQSSDIDAIRICINQVVEIQGHIESAIGFTREFENFGVMPVSWQRMVPLIESAQLGVLLDNVRIVIDIPYDLEVYADPVIRTVFLTLIENAIRHGGNISVIHFSCSFIGGVAVLIIEDDGKGVLSEEKGDIFLPGYGKHSGVGLFIVREILDISGISIRETGVPGKGARFEIIVPAGKYRFLHSQVHDATVSSNSIAAMEKQEISVQESESNDSVISLLVVDDERFVLDVITHYLTEKCGFVVTTVESALEAVHHLVDNSFDAILSDYDMHGMNGLEFHSYVKASGMKTPFLLLTGKGGEDVVINALNAGVDFYIQKGGDSGAVLRDLENKIRIIVANRRNEKKLRKNALILEQRNRELEKARHELIHLNHVLESRVIDRTKEVASLLRHKELYIEMMGHDLKTPLTPICALLPVLLEGETNPESREIIAMLMKDANFMKNFIEKVLLLARLNSEDFPTVLQNTKVREIVDESAVHFWYFLAEKSMKILNQVDDSLTFSMVPLHLEIIVRNLLENAMKYSNQGGVISISAMSDIGTNIFTISDTGTGILPEDKVHIFDEFYLADTSRHKRDSHGLGLSMVKRIVSLYNGSIHVQSPGRDMGTTIIIRLPKKGL